MLDVLGLERATEEELRAAQDAAMRSKYRDPIEQFPDTMDDLLGAINRVSHLFTLSTPLSLSSLALHGATERAVVFEED